MYTFLVTLHVLAAVLVVGPLVFAAVSGYRAVKAHEPAAARAAAATLARAGAGSVLVALLGIGAVFASDRVTFRTPWVVISLTLYVIMMGLATGSTVPALRKAARLLDEGVLARPAVPAAPSETDTADEEAAEPAPPPTVSATATELAAKERLDNLAGRIAGSGGLVALTAVAITVFMVVKPFGD